VARAPPDLLADGQLDLAEAGPRRGHDPLAILAAIEPFDLPQIRIDASVLELADGLDH
jgi:hypothetical protein